MNSTIETLVPMFDAMKVMRSEWLDALTEADLAFNPGGQNLTMGALLHEMCEVNAAYIESLTSGKHAWAKQPMASPQTLDGLRAGFAKQDEALTAALNAFTDETIQKPIDRDGYPMPVEMQLQAYMQALLIYFAKATIYLRAMDKPLPEKLREWIW
jgi:uncharacterized damage-inducible protein DinB